MALRGKELLSSDDAGHIVVRGCSSHVGEFHSALGRWRKIGKVLGLFQSLLKM